MKTVGDLTQSELRKMLREQGLVLRVGPVNARIRSHVLQLADDISTLYKNYPFGGEDCFAHHSVLVAAPTFLRRYFRKNVVAVSDHPSPFVPVPAHKAFVALEMGLNWQMAMGRNRYLLFHASSIAEMDGNAVLMPGGSGSGKSTLAAGLGYSGWRFLGDEFALLDLKSGLLNAFPRPISLKNEAIKVMRDEVPSAVFSRAFNDTLKGTITYVTPPVEALQNAKPVTPRVILFPKFMKDGPIERIPCSSAEALTRLVGASVNYWRLGGEGFQAITRLSKTVPAFHIRFSNMAEGKRLVHQAMEEVLS